MLPLDKEDIVPWSCGPAKQATPCQISASFSLGVVNSTIQFMLTCTQFRWRVTSCTPYTHIYQKASSELRKVSVDTATDVYGNGAHGMKEVNQAFDLPSAKYRAAPQTPTSQMFSEGNGGESYVQALWYQIGAKWYQPRVSSVASSHPPAPFS